LADHPLDANQCRRHAAAGRAGVMANAESCDRIVDVTPHVGREDAMAKGQMRSNKEKKKPKAEHNKKKKGGPVPTSLAARESPFKLATTPYGKKGA
jgi:hypothetical protein